jgi:predicted ATPase
MGRQADEPAHALGTLVGLPFQNSPNMKGMRGDPAQIKGRALVVSRELISSIQEKTPLALLVEDLHYADSSSQEYLFELIFSSGGRENGIFVLGSARPEWEPPDLLTELWNQEPKSEISLTGGFDKRWREQHLAYYVPSPEDFTAVKIELAPLSDEAMRELTLELLYAVTDVPADTLNLIVERAEGIPYYAEEMVNWLIDRGIIDREHKPWRYVPERMKGTPLPTTLRHLLLTRLSMLSDDERFCLQCGSVFGRNFWTGGIAALGLANSAELLDRLKAYGFIDKPPESSLESQEEWSFHQNLMREATYTTILKRERSKLHAKAGDWLTDQAGKVGQSEIFAGVLGEHYERAGDLNLAADWYLLAGEHARSQGGVAEAHKYFARALEMLPPVDHERRWQALLRRGELQFEAGARQADIDALIEMADESGDQDRMAQAMYRKGNHILWTGENSQSLPVLEETLELARSAGNQEIEILVLADLAQAYTYISNLTTAREMADQALAKVEHSKDEEILASIVLPLCIHYGWRFGNIEKSHHLASELVKISQRQGNRGQEALGMNLVGAVYLKLGLYKDSREAFQEGYRLAEMVGRRIASAHARKDLGYIHWRLGDIRTAQRMIEEAKAEIIIYGDIETSGQCSYYLALLLESIEDYSDAARYYEQVRLASKEVGKASLEHEALAGSARCALGQGKLDLARQEIELVWNYVIETGTIGMYFPIFTYQTFADIFDALGDTDQAQAATEAGYTELMESADHINNPQWRRSFLRDVPEHREMVTMWERMND